MGRGWLGGNRDIFIGGLRGGGRGIREIYMERAWLGGIRDIFMWERRVVVTGFYRGRQRGF